MPAFAALLAIAQGALSAQSAAQTLGLVLNVVSSGVDVVAKLTALDSQLAGFVAERRDPTVEEWQALRDRSDTAHERIQDA